MPEELSDRHLVDLLRTDRTNGFDALYRQYAERLFAYALTVLRDRAAAEDATHDSLMAAVAQIEHLRDPDRLRPWLFAITRNRCLRLAGDRARYVASEPEAAVVSVADEAESGLARQEATELVSAALAGLAPVDRDTLALALRHDLDTADVAAAMGSTEATARARVSRARSALTASVTGLLLARAGGDGDGPACPGLTSALVGFAGEWTPLIRKRVARHVASCSDCHDRGHRRAVSYVSAFTVPVALALAPQFRARADESLATMDPHSTGDWLTWRPDGFPQPFGESGGRWARRVILVGVAGGALVLTALVAWQVNAEPPPAEQPAPAASPAPDERPPATPATLPRPSEPTERATRVPRPDPVSPATDPAADPIPSATRTTRAPEVITEPTPRRPEPEPTGDGGDGTPRSDPPPAPTPVESEAPPTQKPPEDSPEPVEPPETEPEPEPEPEPTKPTKPTDPDVLAPATPDSGRGATAQDPSPGEAPPG